MKIKSAVRLVVVISVVADVVVFVPIGSIAVIIAVESWCSSALFLMWSLMLQLAHVP